MTYQVLEMCLSTTERTYDETTGRSISDVHSTTTRIRVVPQTSTVISSSALHAGFKEIVYKSYVNARAGV